MSLPLIDPSIFRAYDIRGIVDDTLTSQSVFLLGQAIGSMAQEGGETRLFVGRDGRLSGPALSESLIAGISSVGIKVLDLGVVPTPVLYYATQGKLASCGVMLTGSHNPPEYNGLKIVMQRRTLAQTGLDALYARVLTTQYSVAPVPAASVYPADTVAQIYLEEILGTIQLARPLRIVVDAGNGVAGPLAVQLYRRLGCSVYPLYCDIDGTFPHHHPDPSESGCLADLVAKVREVAADIGLAFDGDGDRLGVVTARGDIIYADRLLMLFATEILATSPGATVLYDVKCTAHLAELIRAAGGVPLMWRTGHAFIKEKLFATGAILAGEMSGHFFFKDHWYGFDDALYAGARLLALLAKRTEDPHAVFTMVPHSIATPELRLAIPEEKKFAVMARLQATACFAGAYIITIDGVRAQFDHGWGLVRASNTTSHLILRFEADSEDWLEHIQALFRQWLHAVQPELSLPF